MHSSISSCGCCNLVCVSVCKMGQLRNIYLRAIITVSTETIKSEDMLIFVTYTKSSYIENGLEH